MTELLIVGGGLAGAILAAESYSREVSFNWIISHHIPSASYAAYGMCNPVHYRNMVPTWKADEFYDISRSFFIGWEKSLQSEFYKEMPVHHLVVNPEEFVQWRQNVEITTLWKYTNGEPNIEILHKIAEGYAGSILIKKSFFVSIPSFVESIRSFFKNQITKQDFDKKRLIYNNDEWDYEGNTYSKVIFAEGYFGHMNSYFSQLPFNPCKGEILVLKIPKLDLKEAIHKKIVLLPIGNDHYICGATYEWDDLSFNKTEKGSDELLNDLKQIIGDKYVYKIIDHKAGVRPSVSDRRPLVGWHPVHNGIGILNGYGSRGLMVGPVATKNLLDNWQKGIEILPDWNIERFRKRLLKTVE